MSALLFFLFFSVILTCEARPDEQKVYDDQIDQIEPRNEENSNVEENSIIEPELALFEGDIALPIDSLSNQWGDVKGTYVINDRKIWPQGVIPFKIDTTSIVDNEHQELIRQGLNELEEVATCLTFTEVTGEAGGDMILFRSHGDANYPGKGCWSYIGRKGGTQVINLEPPECMDLEHIKHEVLHSLGAIHEHSRSDRDKYIRILEENVQEGKLDNFNITQWSYEDDLRGVEAYGAPYDIYSIMHYPHDAFGIDNSRTIEAVNPKITEFGSTGDLSLTDVMKLNLHYQCDIDNYKIVDYLHEMVIKDKSDTTADILKTVEEKNDKLQEDSKKLQNKVEAQEKRIDELEIANIDYKEKLDGLLRDMEQMKHSMTNLEENSDKNVEVVQSRLESHENESNEILSQLKDKVEDLSSLNLKRTCQEYADSGIKRSGYFWLDPDGPLNPANPIRVWCYFTSESVVTEVLHDSEMTTSVTPCLEPGCYRRNITYSSSRSQLRALMEISEHCYQDIRYDCTHAPLRDDFHNIDYAFWYGDNGKKNIHWNDFNTETSIDDHFCACHLKSQCFDGHKCNCNSRMAIGKFDEGRITDINILPIRELRFGGLQHPSFQSAQHTLGRLKCRGRKPVESGSSCEALRIAGNYWSGYYNVGNGDDVKIVFCNMTSNPWDDSEMEILTGSLAEELEEMHTNFSTQLDYLEMSVNQTIENVETTLTKMPGPPGKQGEKGNQGNVGPKGSKGELGLVGRIGSKGDKGSTGLQGVTGLKGIKGDNGQLGETGPKGIKGEIGVQGINGPKGEKGEIGLKGIRGMTGITGIKGSKGVIGSLGNSGPRGNKGEVGNKGEDGAKGDKGAQGLHGLKGNNGFNGKKGENGSKGNKGENGPKGDNGINGAKGKKGEIGLKGIKGISGIKGSKGAIGMPGNLGPRGNKGEAGNKGEDGTQGVKGALGLPGLKGNKGFDGNKGENGSKGNKGEIGLKGDNGINGARGKKGEIGHKGIRGITGIKGSKGAIGLPGNSGPKGDQGVLGKHGVKGAQGEIGSKGNKGERGLNGNKGLKGVKGEKAQISSQWKSYAYSLMCNLKGSLYEKTTKIRDVIKKDYPDVNWFIKLQEENGGWAFYRKTGSYETWKKSCGYNLLIWTRANSDFTKTSCSTTEQDKAKTIIKSAESSGSSSTSIRDEIKSKMTLFGIEYHFIWVDSGSSNFNGFTYNSCMVHGGNDYEITVYLA